MPGRREMGEADGEWSDASDDAVKSGSATDASKGDFDDGSGARRKNAAGKSTMLPFSPSSSLRRPDPVNSILDKIDAEIAAMSGPSPQASTILGRTSPSCKHRTSNQPLLPKPGIHHKSKLGSSKSSAYGTQSESEQQKIAGSAEIYTDAGLTDAPTDEDFGANQRATEDFLSDLDSVVAQQIDSRFKEIMLRKKVSQSPPPILTPPSQPATPTTPTGPYTTTTSTHHHHHQTSTPTPTPTLTPTPILSLTSRKTPPPVPPKPTALSLGYGTDNDSIKTEDFEARFQSLIVADGNTSGDSGRRSSTKSKRWKNSGGGGGLGGGGSGSGSGGGGSSGHVGSGKKGSLGSGSGLRNGVSGPKASQSGSNTSVKVSFEDSAAKDRESDKSRQSSRDSSPHGCLDRVLQHTMKSTGETAVKQPIDSLFGVASLPPTGRSRSVSPERLFIARDRP